MAAAEVRGPLRRVEAERAGELEVIMDALRFSLRRGSRPLLRGDNRASTCFTGRFVGTLFGRGAAFEVAVVVFAFTFFSF